MNQAELYNILKNAGSKILSFEDFSESDGSWRVNFLLSGSSCEIVGNRKDGYLSLRSKHFKKSINCEKGSNDQFDLITIRGWITLLLLHNAH